MASFENFDDDRDQIYISGLPRDVTEDQLASHFGQIGTIKLDKKKRPPTPKIWLYRDKATGQLKGDATITYEDPFAASQAPSWFDGKEFLGKTLHVSLAEKPRAAAGGEAYGRGGGGGGYGAAPGGGYGDRGGYGGGGGGGDRGGYGGGGGGYGGGGGGYGGGGERGGFGGGRGRGGGGAREGDWLCPGCGNNCFGWRDVCNRCNTPKGDAGAGGGGGGGGRGDFGGGRGDFGGGRGGGRGGGGGRPGDWPCPSCGNNCFGWRDRCNRCNTPKPEGAAGGGGGGGYGAPPPRDNYGGGYQYQEQAPPQYPPPAQGGYPPQGQAYGGPPPQAGGYEPHGAPPAAGYGPPAGAYDGGRGGYGAPPPTAAGPPYGAPAGGPPPRERVVAAPQGPPGLFAPEDWACTACGNVNWARRRECNQCNAPKPGAVDLTREGAGGGFKELDSAEVEEARRRRREHEAREEYDEFGRPRKPSAAEDRAARERAALERLAGKYGARERSRSPRRERSRSPRRERY
ncbi:hypothetical protein ACKKBG_A10390 [Auxenochlorella protothecoides x Auxenochlorella symbiontica]